MLSISLMGNFRINNNEALVKDVDTPRLQSLLAYLLLHREAPQSRAQLAFLFWPETSETQAHTNLRNLLHHLRHALPNAELYIEVRTHTLQWKNNTPFTLDVDDFNAALRYSNHANKTDDSVRVRESLEQAICLYKGDLLPNCYEDWIIPKREELCQAYLRALEQIVRMLEDQRNYPAAIHFAHMLLQHDPLHEAMYRHLICLYALNGDRAGALQIYHICTNILQRELDVEPSTATREVYEQLLYAESRPPPRVTATTAIFPLVGREKELAQIIQSWHTVATGGEPHVVLLRGEAGIGKTRLVEELLQWASQQGIVYANTRCYAAEGDLAYAPAIAWVRAHSLEPLEDVWLTEVARLLPEILAQRPDLPKPAALTESWQRRHLFEALSRAVLVKSLPLLLTVDDLQWCDRDTFEWLHFLLRFNREARLLIVGTYRPEEIGENHPLLPTVQALILEGKVTEVELRPLNEVATKTLATLVANMEVSKEVAKHLFQETEGNPLFVVETVRAGLLGHCQNLNIEVSDDPLRSKIGLPPKVQSVLEARLAQVSPPTREIARLAATIGREFSFRLLSKASGCDEDTIARGLDEMWQRGIVREHGVDSYDFSHDKLREVAYISLSSARRRLNHFHIAQALEQLHGTELDPFCHQLAIHYERANLPEQAIPFYLRAAKVARQVYANEEALTLLLRGISLVGGDRSNLGKGNYEDVVHLWEQLGDILELKAQHKNALQAYKKALTQHPQINLIWQARLHRKEGMVWREQRLYNAALEAFHRAEIVLGIQPDEENTNWWDEWLEVQVEQVWAYYWLAQWPEMNELVTKVKPVVKERGSIASRIQLLNASCLMHLRGERYTVSDEMLANAIEALAASQELDSLKTKIECQFELGFLHLWRREFDVAGENLQTALRLTEISRILPLRTIILTYLTVLCRFQGQVDGVLTNVGLAQKAAEEAQMPDYIAAAKGNLAWLAWRTRDLPAVEQRGKEALALWQQSPLVYPFQWQALWPLIAAALEQDRENEAWSFVRALLEPKQQHLPDNLSTTLEAAVQTKSEGQIGLSRHHLDRAIKLAHELGYL